MNDIHEAYESLGLTDQASRAEIENRYLNIVRRIHAGELRGYVTTMEETQMRTATRAYRYIMQVEKNKQLEEFRHTHYDKYKPYSKLAEQVDEFLHYNKPYMIAAVIFVFIIIASLLGIRMLKEDRAALAAMPDTPLSLTIAGDIESMRTIASVQLLEGQLLTHFPDWNQIDINLTPSSYANLFMLDSDLYLVDQESFTQLMRLGYLKKLDKWNTYGIDLSNGPLAEIIPLQHQPLIAAVNVNAEHPEQAISFIDYFVNSEFLQQQSFIKVEELRNNP